MTIYVFIINLLTNDDHPGDNPTDRIENRKGTIRPYLASSASPVIANNRNTSQLRRDAKSRYTRRHEPGELHAPCSIVEKIVLDAIHQLVGHEALRPSWPKRLGCH